ncbi:MAG: shikimate dehydrogenase [Clostridia bacterium]|nr:shikimate dehydrogenase [Clostridia bacterium]
MDARTKLTGIIGYPVEHSFSPAMHNAAFVACGLNWVYLAFAVRKELLADALAGVRGLGLVGINVTVPHKEEVLPLLDELDPLAARIGAVNTVVNEGGRLKGYNTDAYGFLTSLREEGFDPAGKKAVILGAGGAARAVAFGLAGAGLGALVIANRSPERARELAAALKKNIPALQVEWARLRPEEVAPALREADLLVQTTSVGMYPKIDVSPLEDYSCLRPGLWVYDLVYNPRQTKFLKAARAAGCRTLDGLGMLVHQGAAAFRLWTGLQPPLEVMRQAVVERLGA